MTAPSKTLRLACIALTIHAGARVSLAAYCALRDPVQEIHRFFPKAETHRSILRIVDANAREAVAERLPFTLHFNELAKHTLYVAIKESRPLGLVHVRSEKGKWGLVEIAWALDLDLNIQGFRFQRCRDLHKKALQREAFTTQIIGKGLHALRPMLSEDGLSLRADQIAVPKGGEALALTLLRSALKTISVTDIVWARDLTFLRALAAAHSVYPATHKLIQIPEVYTSPVRTTLERMGLGKDSPVRRETAEVFLALDSSDALAGLLMKLECFVLGRRVALWLGVTSDHRIHRVYPVPERSDDSVAEALMGLVGMTERDIKENPSASQKVGIEAIIVSQYHSKG